jgi:hypothetical protein
MRSCVIVLVSLIAAIGCADDRKYAGAPQLYQVALTSNTPAAFTAGEDSVYIVERRVELPVRKPSPTELDDLRKAKDTFGKLPFPRLPWVERGDLELQVDFTLSNLDDQPHDVAVTLNGFDEFFEYQPGITVNDDQVIPDYAQWERLYKLERKQRVTRTIREEDLDEAATDLATVVNGAPNSNEVVYFENKSGTDTRSQRYVPKVIPGLMGFRIGIRATGLGRILLEASVRMRDSADRLAASGEEIFHVHPELFMPVAPAL